MLGFDFLENLPCPICVLDKNKKIIFCNSQFLDFGFSKEKIEQKNFLDLFLEKKELKKSFLKTEKGFLEKNKNILLLENKRKAPVILFFKKVNDFFFVCLLDIEKEQKEKEDLLKKIESANKELRDTRLALLNILEDSEKARRLAEEEKEKTVAVLENFVEPLFLFDDKNKLRLINKAAQRFFRLTEAEVLGKDFLDFKKIYPLNEVFSFMENGLQECYEKEVAIKNKEYFLKVSVKKITFKRRLIAKLVLVRNITHEKMVEKIKTEFVSLAAHQLRTPLAAIKWSLKMVLDGDLGKITSDQKDVLNKAYQSNERMIRLINDLLNVTRIEEGRYIFRKLPVHLEKIVDSVIEDVKEEIERKKILFSFERPAKPLPKIRIDPEKIRLVIQNLIENAVKYTPEKGKITVVLEMVEFKNPPSKEIIFSVKDTGVGIPQQEQDKIFSKFFRGSNVVRMDTEGTGLGLFISKNIIEAHGGKIWFESEEGRGTIFYFTLPIGPPPKWRASGAKPRERATKVFL